jgi:hypothetical protein
MPQPSEQERLKEAETALDKLPDNPLVMKVLVDNAHNAAYELTNLLSSRNENVRLAAARDILDRSGYKPIERKDITSAGSPIQSTVNIISDEELTKILDAYAGRRNAITTSVVTAGSEDSGIEEDI